MVIVGTIVKGLLVGIVVKFLKGPPTVIITILLGIAGSFLANAL